MQIKLIRNATLVLDYGGKRLLIDPDFGVKHSRPSFTGKSPNPMVDLPLTLEQILDGVELVIVSHLHSDHFDKTAQEIIPKNLPLICQPGNDRTIREKGFLNVTPLLDQIDWNGIHITLIGGHHGLGEVETQMGKVSGFVFQSPGEPILYWAGDTVLCDEVQDAIAHFQPDVIVTHSCGATWAKPSALEERDLIVMDAAQTIEVCRLAPTSKVFAVHMEALDHATISRLELRNAAQEAGITPEQLFIPADGESVSVGVSLN
ncbi:MAG TPA: MBL fold metallo-hydrolase [Phototrophicaceae bacterium]|jgi:L-ascorbate metabolism protein UlaG (beta-lactamase superfamily)|nr:MBL fold metallo-hydrolase [Phototrophicaceae bacterium]